MIRGHIETEYESYAYECTAKIQYDAIIVECSNELFPVPEIYGEGDIVGLLSAGYSDGADRTYSLLSGFSFVSRLKPPINDKKKGLLQDEIEELMWELSES